MTHDLSLALLAAGVLCELVCLIGVLWFQDVFDQLHYAGAASTVGLAAIAVAVGLTGFSSPSGTIDCILALILTFALNPVTTALTGRVSRRREYGSLTPKRAEFRQQP